MSDEVDEWEQADISALKIEVEKVATKPSVVIPARLLARPINADIIFFQDGSSTLSNPPTFRHETPPTLTVPLTTPVYDDNVDPALLDALRNPRERLHVLNIEHSLYSFTMSSERSMEFPPVLNSFRRLIAYRVAHRFRLGHSPSDMMNENGERGIVFYKQVETLIPNPLLIDIDVTSGASQHMQQFHMNVVNVACIPASTISDVDPQGIADFTGYDQQQQQQLPKKVVVMKRRDNGGAELKKERAAQQTVCAAEKEKAYAEARARIFGVETMSAPSVDSDSVLSAMSSVAITLSSSVSNLASYTEPTSTSILTSASNSNLLALDHTVGATTGNRQSQHAAAELVTSINISEEGERTVHGLTKELGTPVEKAKPNAKAVSGSGIQNGGAKSYGTYQSSGNVKSSRVPRSGPPPSPIGMLNAEPFVADDSNSALPIATESAGVSAVSVYEFVEVEARGPQKNVEAASNNVRSQSLSPAPSSSTLAVANKNTASNSNLLENAKSIQRDQTAEKYEPDFSRGLAAPAHSPVTIPAPSGGMGMGGPRVGVDMQSAGGVRMMYPALQSQQQYHQPYMNQYHPSAGQDEAYAPGQTVYYTSNTNPLQTHGQLQQQQQWTQFPPHMMIPGPHQYDIHTYYPHSLSTGAGLQGQQYNFSSPPMHHQQWGRQEPLQQQLDQPNRQGNRQAGYR